MASAAGISSNSSKRCARRIPVCLNSASYIRSEPASAPVCEIAALAPASERPILNATIGLPACAARKAAARNLLTSRTVSTYSAITFVASSSTSQSMKSANSRSTSLLVEIILASPIPRADARASNEPKIPPLCETRLIAPDGK